MAIILTVKKAFKSSIPVMTGYLVLGTGFGLLLNTKGYGALWAFAMSVIIYSGAMQFVMIDLITGGASLTATALTSLMLGARHLFYGISMLGRYKNIAAESSIFSLEKLKKFYMIYGLTDETYALVSSADFSSKSEFKKYCFFVTLFDHIYWVTGSVLGGILGEFLPFNTKGIDFALTALFISICVEQWLDDKNKKINHLSALTGFSASIACLIIFGRDNFLVPAMLAITIILMMLKPIFNSKNSEIK